MLRPAAFSAFCFMIWLGAGSVTPRADAVWVNGSPVFRSNIERRRRDQIRRASRNSYPRNASGGPRPMIAPEAPPTVTLTRQEQPGTVIIDQRGRKLYYIISPRQAFLYPISVGRDGFRWSGTKRITAIKSWPTWTPPADMRRRQAWLPVTMSGGLRNPLGVKALYLESTLHRMHGTNDPKSIGRASSSGCFRMKNEHVLHLATLADVGTVVRVTRQYRQ